MKDFTLDNITESVVSEYASKIEDPRLKKVMVSLIEHLHSFVSEVELTEEEWFTAIQFLTNTGQICDDKRQEFILLSDSLGVSSLVDALNHQRGGIGTENAVLGPFYVSGAPDLPMGTNISQVPAEDADIAVITGRVTDENGQPIANAVLDVWQASKQGFYHMQDDTMPEFNLCGKFTTQADGNYSIVSEKPGSYPIPTDGPVGKMLKSCGRHYMRPGHLHFIITAPGFDRLTTQIFTKGDEYLDSDAVFGTKSSLIGDYKKVNDKALASQYGIESPFLRVEFNFTLMNE